MSCASFVAPVPTRGDPVTVQKHRKKGIELTYMNVRMQGELPGAMATLTPAEQYVSRSGGIIDSAKDYYVGITRMRFSLNVPLMIAPPLFVGGQWDRSVGDTAWQVGVSYVGGAGNPTSYTGSAYIKIPVRNRRAGIFTTPPTDYSCSFPTLTDWYTELNRAVSTAFDACVAAAAGAPTPVDAAAKAPFFSISDPGSGRMKLTMFPYSVWANDLAQSPVLYLRVNYESVPAFGGWDLEDDVSTGLPPQAGFTDAIIRAESDGYNYSPGNAAGAEDLVPTNPATTSLIIQQTSPNFTVPGVTRVSVLSTLPVNPEFTPSVGGKGSQRILTDFSIDSSQYTLGDNRDVFIYDAAGTDGTRWIKLMGGPNTITEFTLKVVTEDWQGIVRPFFLRGPADVVDIKLCFAPVHVVEG